MFKALEQGRGVILLAMHFGSWELASLACAMMGRPYKVVVKPQRNSRLDDLLNSYRECGGSVVIERGLGTREFVKSLKENNIVAMVVDQGGREGMRVPFFNRQASMSVGAIRMGLKFQTPLCFATITRIQGPYHRLVIQPPLALDHTGNSEKDILTNLTKATQIMEKDIREFPWEYMWFYKIWKYSMEGVTVILNDGRMGHLRQSQAIARQLDTVLSERGISQKTHIVEIKLKNRFSSLLLAWLSLFIRALRGRMWILQGFLTPESYESLMSVKADTVISCGSSLAPINYLMAKEQQAKGIVILRPGLLNTNLFDLAVLPQHDISSRIKNNVVVTKGAPNLITPDYLDQQSDALTRRFSHLKIRDKMVLGFLIGGDTRHSPLSEKFMKVVIHQIQEVLIALDADILISTSRRTPEKIVNLVQREFKKHPACRLLILANSNNVPEAVGGILGLSDLVVVSGDSISMVSEAAASGKKTVVFPIRSGLTLEEQAHKQQRFIQKLHEQGYILCSDPKDIKQGIYALAKNKIQTRPLDDNSVILEGLRKIY